MNQHRMTWTLSIALALTLRPSAEAALGQLPPGPRLPVPPGPKTRVTAVSTLQVAPATTAGRLTIAWGPAAPGAVASYEVYRVGGVAGGASELIATLVRGETSLEQPMPTPGGPVGYQVIANNVDQSRDVSPWINYAPPPLQATALSVAPNYNQPTLSWQEIAGVRYALWKSLQPGVASYPPIKLLPVGAVVVSLGGMRSLSMTAGKTAQFQKPLADLHQTTHFQLITDNGRGEVITGSWIPYVPNTHGGVTGASGSYWVVPNSNGTRQVWGCVSWTPISGAPQYGLSVIHGVMTQWPAIQRFVAGGMGGINVGILAPGEPVDPVTVRVETDYFGDIDSQHAVNVVLTQVQQPLTCAAS